MFTASIKFNISEAEQKRRILALSQSTAQKKQTLEVEFPDDVINDSRFIKIHSDGTPIVREGSFDISRVSLRNPTYKEVPGINPLSRPISREVFFSSLFVDGALFYVNDPDKYRNITEDDFLKLVDKTLYFGVYYEFDKTPTGEEYYNRFVKNHLYVYEKIATIYSELVSRHPSEEEVYKQYIEKYDIAKAEYEAAKIKREEEKKALEEQNAKLAEQFIIGFAALVDDDYLLDLYKGHYRYQDRFAQVLFNYMFPNHKIILFYDANLSDVDTPSYSAMEIIKSLPKKGSIASYNFAIETDVYKSNKDEVVEVRIIPPDFLARYFDDLYGYIIVSEDLE